MSIFVRSKSRPLTPKGKYDKSPVCVKINSGRSGRNPPHVPAFTPKTVYAIDQNANGFVDGYDNGFIPVSVDDCSGFLMNQLVETIP
ncbi:hypothetical protein GCM10028818_57420 [Spirosoma horti]